MSQIVGHRLGKNHDHGAAARQRMMLYCHDSVGIGHFRRGLAICQHLAGRFPGASFLLATGTPYVPLFALPQGVDYLKLPSIAKGGDGEYHSKTLGLGTRQVLGCRRALLLSAVRYFRPSVFLVDKAPAGVCREMVPTLKWMQRNCPQTRVVFGMRDIEDSPEATIRQWSRDGVPEVLEECFDEIWVYGMQAVYDVAREYRLSPKVQSKLRYQGYFHRRPCDHPFGSRPIGPHVLVTVGGGTDGAALLAGYLAEAARRVAGLGGESTLIGGPDLPREAAARLRQIADRTEGITWLDHTSCMSCHMRPADLVVCMGGYNTLCEVASLGKRALVVPRVLPRLEQAMRADRWERLGLVRVLHPDRLTPAELAAGVVRLLDSAAPPDRFCLDMRALERIEQRVSALWKGVADREAALCL